MMNCPICGKELVQTENALECSGRQDGCSFFIRNSISGHSLTDREKEDLVQKGITDEISDFRSREGKNFAARLKLDDVKKVIFVFPDRRNPEESMRCPLCGKAIHRSDKVWCCTDRECGFVIFNSMSGHFFMEGDMETLYQGKEIGPFDDFISRSGKNFKASVKLGDDGKAHFVFPKRDAALEEMSCDE